MPVLAIFMGVQCLGVLISRYVATTSSRLWVCAISGALAVQASIWFLSDRVGKYKLYSEILLVPCFFIIYAFMFEPPGPLWFILLAVEFILVAATTICSFREAEKEQLRKVREAAEAEDQALSRLRQFRIRLYKQYIIISQVKGTYILDVIDDNCALFSLPDNLHIVILAKVLNEKDFRVLLDEICYIASEDSNVFGYWETDRMDSVRMLIPNPPEIARVVVKGDTEFIPFDLSLLDAAEPVVS